jgi:tyrosinase
MFERRDIWELSDEDPWHPVIEWYARGIAVLKRRESSDPSSWRYLAAIHGTDISRFRWPRGATWNECQHSSWFFLPWHRIYLHYFERVVRQAVVSLRGPDDWALPYWDYSDPERPDVRRLPPAFRQQRMPSGDPNPLFIEERERRMKAGGELTEGAVDISAALSEVDFTGPLGGVAGFGGPVTGFMHGGGPVGSLENTPHGDVHVEVGGIQPRGFMSRFETAGLDPLFWLHHANIDRLWEVWLGLGGRRANPTDPRWLNMRFRIGSGTPAVTLTVREVLDTTRAPLTYRYSNISLPGERRGLEDVAAEEVPMPEDLFPEMVGASEERVSLTAESTEVEVAIGAPSGPARRGLAEDEQPQKVYLKVENVKGTDLVAPSYLVHVNLPPGADPAEHADRQAGRISMFGVAEASDGMEEHSGSGLTFSFDITNVAQRLQEAGDWDPERLRVTFTPVGAGEAQGGNVSAGRVSLFYA